MAGEFLMDDVFVAFPLAWDDLLAGILRRMRLGLLAILFAPILWPCSCIGVTNLCGAPGGSWAVFVARVLRDSGEGWGKGPARAVIEEVLQNVPSGSREVEIDTQAGTSCYFRLKAGERYVIVSHVRSDRYSVGHCSQSFQVRGNEHILDAMRSVWRGGPTVLVGRVSKSTSKYRSDGGIPGVTVVAEKDGTRHETVTDDSGHYMIRELEAGRYAMSVRKPGYIPDDDFNRRWSGRMVLDPVTRVIAPDRQEPRGSVTLAERACWNWDLSMWLGGSIRGTVRSETDGAPLAGLEVQAFPFDPERGVRESSPSRSARTAGDGTYLLESLPPGKYVVAGPAAFHRGDERLPVTLTEGGSLIDVDITMPQAPIHPRD